MILAHIYMYKAKFLNINERQIPENIFVKRLNLTGGWRRWQRSRKTWLVFLRKRKRYLFQYLPQTSFLLYTALRFSSLVYHLCKIYEALLFERISALCFDITFLLFLSISYLSFLCELQGIKALDMLEIVAKEAKDRNILLEFSCVGVKSLLLFFEKLKSCE